MAEPVKASFVEQARRAQIIDATIETIAQFGYAGASIARIAKTADISVGLVSYHFGSKDELLRQVARRLGDRLEGAIVAATEDAESYSDALRGLIESHVRFTSSDTPEATALSQIFRSGVQAAPMQPSDDERQGWLADFEGLIRGGQAAGEFRACDPQPVAVAIVAALEASPAVVRGRPDVDAGHYAAELADLFVTAVAAHR